MERLSLILLMALCACSSVHSRAVDRARQARQLGDLAMEARAWREACAAKPSDHEACAAGEAAARGAVAQALSASAELCATGRPASCLEALRTANNLLPNDPRLLATVDEQLRRHVESCGSAATIADGIERLSCLERLPWESSSWSRTLWDERRALSLQMDRLGAGSSSPPATLAWATAASCLDGGDRRMTIDRALGRIVTPVNVRVQMRGASVDLCPWLRHPGIHCGGSRPERVVEVTGRLERPRHVVREEIQQVSYQAGVRRLPNPAHYEASERVLQAEQAVEAVALEERLLTESCVAAEKAWRDAEMCLDCPPKWERDRLCDGARTAKRLLGDRERERDTARRTLSGTAQFVEEPLMRNHRSREKHHVWEAGWTASISGQRVDGLVRLEDLERAGFPAAGIEADPLEEPRQSDFERALASQLAPHVEADLSHWLGSRVRGNLCDGPVQWNDRWLGCWVETTVARGAVPDGEELIGSRGLRCSSVASP